MSNTDPENIALDQAFEKLSGRISTLTAAFDRFGLRQDELVGRDYSEDLANIDTSWQKTREALRNLAAQPVLTMTPDRVAEQIEMASRRVRSRDHEYWQIAQNRLSEVVRSLDLRLGAARTRDEQNKWIGIFVGAAGILAFIVGCAAPSASSRAAPESWHWPEQRAANILSRDMWGAGVRLMQVGNPESWKALARASQIYRENKKTIAECEKQAQRRKKAVYCSLEIEAVRAR